MADKEAVANVQRYFKELNANLGNFKKLSKQLGTKSDNEGLRDSIQSLRSKIDSLVRVLKDDGIELVQKKTYKDKFKRDFDSLMKQYKQLNSTALAKERKFEVRGSVSADLGTHAISDFDKEQNQARRQTQIAQQKTLAEKIRRQTLMTNAAIQQEQHEESVKINRDLGVVKDMFTDLGKLTEKQGEQIEKIEVQVDDTADSIAKGTKELDEAKRLQASLRKEVDLVSHRDRDFVSHLHSDHYRSSKQQQQQQLVSTIKRLTQLCAA